MGVVEQNIALVTKDNKNNTVLQYPLTTVSQVEGLGEILNASIKNITANNDSIIITKNDNSSGYIVIDNVQNAIKAQKDSREQVIDGTYIKSLSVNGRTITITKGDGTTSTITTQDTNTTYSPASSSVLGLVKTGTNITNNSGTISITKSNVVNALGYTPPTVNTTYNVATQTTNGLMSANDKKKLDTIKYQSGRNASMWR